MRLRKRWFFVFVLALLSFSPAYALWKAHVIALSRASRTVVTTTTTTTSTTTTTFVPSLIASAAVYYNSDTGVLCGGSACGNGGAVDTWQDQTANTLHVTQSTGSAKPTYVATDADFNNKPSLSFDGGDNLSVADNAVFDVGTGDFWFAIVGKFTSQFVVGRDSYPAGGYTGWFLSYNDAFGGGANTFQLMARFNGGAASNYVNGSSATTNTAAHLIIGKRISDVLYLVEDGTAKGTSGAVSVNVSNNSNFKIGDADDNAGFRFNGKISMYVYGNGTLSNGDQTNLVAFSQSTYGTP